MNPESTAERPTVGLYVVGIGAKTYRVFEVPDEMVLTADRVPVGSLLESRDKRRWILTHYQQGGIPYPVRGNPPTADDDTEGESWTREGRYRMSDSKPHMYDIVRVFVPVAPAEANTAWLPAVRSALQAYKDWRTAVSDSQHDSTDKFNERVRLLDEADRKINAALQLLPKEQST
jgi:hypothetical protein